MNKILIIEDDLEINALLADFLKEKGYAVHCQYDGLHVLDFLNKEKIDLIILDIMLPYRSGDIILSDVRKKFTIPVIIISAKETTQNKIDLLRLGADDYITKPFDMEEVLARIQGCFMNYPWADLTYCILAITSLILFLIHWSCKKAQINSISLYRTFFQRYSFYIVNRDWLCLETHTVPAKRHCHKSSPSFLSLYLPDPSRTLPDAGCCMRIF